jgi:hypothetical protein
MSGEPLPPAPEPAAALLGLQQLRAAGASQSVMVAAFFTLSEGIMQHPGCVSAATAEATLAEALVVLTAAPARKRTQRTALTALARLADSAEPPIALPALPSAPAVAAAIVRAVTASGALAAPEGWHMRASAITWLTAYMLQVDDHSPLGRIFSCDNGGAEFTAAVIRAELSALCGPGLSESVFNAEDAVTTLTDALALLPLCACADAGALRRGGGATALLRHAADTLRLRDACASSCALSLVTALMQRDAWKSAAAHAAALTEVGQSQVLRASCAALRDADVPLRVTESAAVPWRMLASVADAWPGGLTALARVLRDADPLPALRAAQTRLRRMRDAYDSLHMVTHALEALTAVQVATAAAAAHAAERAAAELLAEEEAAAAATKAKASKKADAKARRAAAMAAAAAAAEALRAAEEAQRAAEAAAAEAEREEAAAARQRARRQQARQQASPAPQPAPLPPPAPPAPQPPPLPVPLPLPQEGRASDAALAALFPWMRIDDAPAAPPPPPSSGGAGGASGSAAPQEEDDGDDGSCAVCMDAERTTALVPCGHVLLCSSCAARVLATAAPACPVCRVPATAARAA